MDEPPSTTSTSHHPLLRMCLLYLWYYHWQMLGVSGVWLLCYVLQAQGAAPDSWEERVPESGSMEVDGVSAVEVAEGREEEVSAAMEVEGEGAEPTRAPLGAMGTIATSERTLARSKPQTS